MLMSFTSFGYLAGTEASKKPVNLAGTEASKKPVSQYEINGTLVANYESASEASRKIGKPQGRSSICKCCNGQLNTYNGYVWKWSSQ